MGTKIELPKKEKTVNTNLAPFHYTWQEKTDFCELLGKKYNKEYGPGTIFNDSLFLIFSFGASFEYIENNFHKIMKG